MNLVTAMANAIKTKINNIQINPGGGVVRPVIVTEGITNITDAQLTANGTIVDFGDASQTLQFRFVYGTASDNLSLGTQWTSNLTVGPVTAQITGLSPNSAYYVALEVRDTNRPNLGITRGNVVSGTTLNSPLDADSYINITGSITGSGVVALDSTSVPTITGGSLVNNEVVFTDTGSATTLNIDQQDGQASFTRVDPVSKFKPNRLTVDGSSTASAPVFLNEYDNLLTAGSKIIVDDGGTVNEVTAGAVSKSISPVPVTTMSSSFTCQFDYMNKASRQNIYKTTTVNDITGWTTGTSLPGALGYSQAIVTKSRVYLLGGYNGSSYVSTVYTAPINPDGTLGDWTTGTSLPGALGISQAIVTKSRVYLLGGRNSAAVTTVYTAPINPDGTLGAWTTGTSLPGAAGASQAIVTKSRVYLLGGFSAVNNTSAFATVYTAPINPDGTLGAWTTGTSLPGKLYASQAIVTKSRVYLLGGQNGSAYTSTVYTAPINPDGTLGAWTTGTSLPDALASSQAIVTKSRAYLLGGHNGSITVSTVYTAPINPDGTLGAWTTGTSLPDALVVSQAIVTKSRVYLLGGQNIGAVSTVYTAPFADGWETLDNDASVYDEYYKYSLASTAPALANNPTSAYVGGQSTSIYAANIYAGKALTVDDSTTTSEVALLSDTSGVIAAGESVSLNSGAGGSDQNVVFENVVEGVSPIPVTVMSRGFSCQYDYLNAPSRQNIYKETTVANITNWTTGTSLPGVLHGSQAIVTKSRVYLLGGAIGTSYVSTVYTAPINPDGTLGAWTTGTSLPGTVYGSQAIVTKSRIYLLGGYSGSASVSTVYTAPINSDGTLGAWTTGTSLPGGLHGSQAIVTKSRVYLLGGYNGSTVATVYTAPINPDGTLGAWTTGTSLPGTLGYSQAIVTKSRVYLLGGISGSTSTSAVATVYTAPINPDGTLGAWTTGTSLPGALGYSQAIVTKSRVYLLGGYNGSASVATVYTAPFADGWETLDNDASTYDEYYKYSLASTAPALANNPTSAYVGGQSTSIYAANIYAGKALAVDDSTTTSEVALLSDTAGVITSGEPASLNSGAGGSDQNVVFENVVERVSPVPVTTMSSSFTCQFDYMNKASCQNIYKATTVNDITGWTTGTSLPGALYSSQAIVTKSRVYLLGGWSSTAVSTVYIAPINPDGTLGDWTTGTSLPGALGISQAIVTKSRVYLLGGLNASTAVSTVYIALINPDGTLGAWTTGTSLPGALYTTQAIVTKSRVYLLGGKTSVSTTVSTVYTAPINPDGTLGAWTTGTSLPGAAAGSQAIVTKSRVYLLGGHNGSAYTSTVYTAPINPDGTLGAWTTGTSLPDALQSSQAIVTKSRVYLLGGKTSVSTTVSTVYTAPINPDGTLGAWTTGTSLPDALQSSQAIVTKSRVYLLGGHNGSSYTSTVYTAPFADGWETLDNDASTYDVYKYTCTEPTPSLVQAPTTAYKGQKLLAANPSISLDSDIITATYDSVALPSGSRSVAHRIDGGIGDSVTGFGNDSFYIGG